MPKKKVSKKRVKWVDLTQEERRERRIVRRIKIKVVVGRVIFGLLKIAKPAIKAFAEKVLIPKLQEEINAGAIDKQVDALIADIVEELLECL